MKKTILGMILAFTFVGYAQENVLTFNIGTIESTEDNAENETLFGASYFQAKGKNEIGFAYNIDLLSTEDIYSGSGISLELEQKLIGQSIGFSYGVSDNFYVIPSVGLTYLEYEWTDLINGGSLGESEWGYNIGADLVYKSDSRFTFGLGTRYTSSDLSDFVQFQAKIGFAF